MIFRSVGVKKVLNIIIGCLFCSIGVLLLRHSQLVTGGVPGMALIVSYLTGIPFSVTVWIVSIPFLILSIVGMGKEFTLYSFFAAICLSSMTGLDYFLPNVIISEWVGAVLGSTSVGFGLAYLFCNGASLGGVNVLVLYLQRQKGFDPGKVTLLIDAVIILLGAVSQGFDKGIYSFFSIVIISVIISFFRERIASNNMLEEPSLQLD